MFWYWPGHICLCVGMHNGHSPAWCLDNAVPSAGTPPAFCDIRSTVCSSCSMCNRAKRNQEDKVLRSSTKHHELKWLYSDSCLTSSRLFVTSGLSVSPHADIRSIPKTPSVSRSPCKLSISSLRVYKLRGWKQLHSVSYVTMWVSYTWLL